MRGIISSGLLQRRLSINIMNIAPGLVARERLAAGAAASDSAEEGELFILLLLLLSPSLLFCPAGCLNDAKPVAWMFFCLFICASVGFNASLIL